MSDVNTDQTECCQNLLNQGAVNSNGFKLIKSSCDEFTGESYDDKQPAMKTARGGSDFNGQSHIIQNSMKNTISNEHSCIKCDQSTQSELNDVPTHSNCLQCVTDRSVLDHLGFNNKVFASHKYETSSGRTIQGTCTCNGRKDYGFADGKKFNCKISEKNKCRERVEKQLVRLSEPNVCANVIIRKLQRRLNFSENNEFCRNKRKIYNARYAVPELYSSLPTIKPMDIKVNNKRSFALQPEIMKLIDMKSSRKLNFSPEDHLFKNLIDLNITDIFLKTPRCGQNFRRTYPKDEAPNLCDVFQPMFIGEYTAWPKVSLKRIGQIMYFDGVALNRHVLGWEDNGVRAHSM